MKKLICVLLLIACAAMFFGCGNIDDEMNAPNEEQEENGSENKTPSASDENEEGESEDADPCMVSKAEWEAALSFELPVTQTSQHVWYPKSETSEERFIYYSIIECDGDKIHVLDMDESLSKVIGERYFVKNGDTYTRYYKGNGDTWSVEASSQYSFDNMRYERVTGWDGEYGLAGEFLYDEFVYDENEQVYKLDIKEAEFDGEKTTLYNIKLKFNNNKLEYYYFEAYIDGYNCAKTTLGYTPVELVLPFEPQ